MYFFINYKSSNLIWVIQKGYKVKQLQNHLFLQKKIVKFQKNLDQKIKQEIRYKGQKHLVIS